MRPTPKDLLRRYEYIHASRMRGLPFLNPALAVATFGFRPCRKDSVGVLLTPWFMNLVVLPGGDDARGAQGARIDYTLPGAVLEMTAHQDEVLGCYLSAVLYRDVTAIPDMAVASRLAADILDRLFDTDDVSAGQPRGKPRGKPMTRRSLFTGADDV